MPNTQGSAGGQDGQQKFVDRVQMAIMQFVILNKAQQGEVTRENLQQTFRGSMQIEGDHFEHCLNVLVQERHLKDVGGNKYTITDDGREDIQKLESLILEVPNVIQQGGRGQQQKTGMTQQKGVGGGNVGGSSGGNVGSSSGTTGSTVGNQGNTGSSTRQGSDVGGNQPTTSGGNSVSKGGATQPTGNKQDQNR